MDQGNLWLRGTAYQRVDQQWSILALRRSAVFETDWKIIFLCYQALVHREQGDIISCHEFVNAADLHG